MKHIQQLSVTAEVALVADLKVLLITELVDKYMNNKEKRISCNDTQAYIQTCM